MKLYSMQLHRLFVILCVNKLKCVQGEGAESSLKGSVTSVNF